MSRLGQGKLITVWNPLSNKEGATTIACGLGVAIHMKSEQKVLIVNADNKYVRLENYIDKDIPLKYSLDNLKGLGKNVQARDISVFSTQISEGLHLLSGTALGEALSDEFITNFIEQSRLSFDYIIVDIGTGDYKGTQQFLDAADITVSVLSASDILLGQTKLPTSKDLISKLEDKKNLVVLNKVFTENIQDDIKLVESFGLSPEAVFPMSMDIYKKCHVERQFYSYIYSNLNKQKAENFISELGFFALKLIQLSDEELYELIQKQNRRSWFGKNSNKNATKVKEAN